MKPLGTGACGRLARAAVCCFVSSKIAAMAARAQVMLLLIRLKRVPKPFYQNRELANYWYLEERKAAQGAAALGLPSQVR